MKTRTRTAAVPSERQLLGLVEITTLTGLPKSAIYALIDEGKFPSFRKLGRRTLWLRSEIEDWMRRLEKHSTRW